MLQVTADHGMHCLLCCHPCLHLLVSIDGVRAGRGGWDGVACWGSEGHDSVNSGNTTCKMLLGSRRWLKQIKEKMRSALVSDFLVLLYPSTAPRRCSSLSQYSSSSHSLCSCFISRHTNKWRQGWPRRTWYMPGLQHWGQPGGACFTLMGGSSWFSWKSLTLKLTNPLWWWSSLRHSRAVARE